MKEVTEQYTLRLQDPRKGIAELQQRIDDCQHRLTTMIQHVLDKKQYQLETSLGKLDNLSPLALLARGYALCQHAVTLRPIKTIDDIHIGEHILVRLSKGQISCEVKEKRDT